MKNSEVSRKRSNKGRKDLYEKILQHIAKDFTKKTLNKWKGISKLWIETLS